MKGLQKCLYRRAFISQPCRCSTPLRHYSSAAESLSHNTQRSVWVSLIPKYFRERKNPPTQLPKPRSTEWNPATFFIIIFLLIGSNAIQMITLRNDFRNFSRKADAKIGLLKEVLERVHRGEDVDVKGLLGTGNEEQEREWEEVLREIEEDEQLVESKAEKRARKSKKGVTSSDGAVAGWDLNTLSGKTMDAERKNADRNLMAGATDTTSTKASKRPAFY